MKRGRTIRRIVASLAIGVVMTVLVAWLAQRPDLTPSPGQTLASGPWPIAVPPEWPREPDDVFLRHNATSSLFSYRHGWEDWRERVAIDPSALTYNALEYRIGWPLRALVAYEAFVWTKSGENLVDLGLWRSGLPVPRRWRIISNYLIGSLPILPLWPGFIGNTMFYGLFTWLAMAGFSTTKRRRRVRRGLCIACAYPLTGGEVCPECGLVVGVDLKTNAATSQTNPAATKATPTPHE